MTAPAQLTMGNLLGNRTVEVSDVFIWPYFLGFETTRKFKLAQQPAEQVASGINIRAHAPLYSNNCAGIPYIISSLESYKIRVQMLFSEKQRKIDTYIICNKLRCFYLLFHLPIQAFQPL